MIAQTIPMSENIIIDSLRLEKIRHSCAHVMAMAVQSLFPETKVTIGPTTESGFYYDFDRPSTFTPEDLGKIEKKMREIIKANLPIIREVVERAEIQEKLRELGENYKLEILDSIPENEIITRYFIGFPDYQTPALAPVQIKLLHVNNELLDYTQEVFEDLKQAGYRVEIDKSGERLGKQIRIAELEKIPILAILGNRELDEKNLSIRTRQLGDLGSITISNLKVKLANSIKNKTIFSN